jgi:hypothetical protein
MLDLRDATTLSEQDWERLPSRTELPWSWHQYASGAGAVSKKLDSTRQYCRIALRSIAIIWQGDGAHAVYTKDVSKSGIGLYSPVQLLPKAAIQLWVPGRSLLKLKVSRCKRIADRCFEVGTLFEIGASMPRG